MFASMVMAAALFFTVGGIFMKLSEGLTKFWPTVIVLALFVIGAALQTLAMKREDLAVTYLWVLGIESILAFAFGVLLFSESCTPARIAGVVLIAGGLISLRSAQQFVRVPLRGEAAGESRDGRVLALRNRPRLVQRFVDRAVDLLQLGKQFGGETEIAVAGERKLFVLTPELFVDGAEPDQLLFLHRGEALVAIALGDEALDRRGKRRPLGRRSRVCRSVPRQWAGPLRRQSVRLKSSTIPREEFCRRGCSE